MLDLLRERGVKIGLVSNTSRDLGAFVDHFKLPVDAWVWSGRHGKVKPSPTIFMAVLDERVAPEAAVMVGDSLEDDVEGARALGMRAYLVDRDGRHGGRGRHPDPARASGAHRSRGRCLIARLRSCRAVEESLETPVRGLMWSLGLGAFGLAWSITTVAAYLRPSSASSPTRPRSSGSSAAEGLFAFFMPLFVGPMSDATHLPLGRRRPFMVLALVPMAVSSRCSRSCPLPGDGARPLRLLLRVLHLRAALPRPLPDLVPDNYFGRAQGVQHVLRGTALGAALVGGGFLLSVWEPFPFILAAGVTSVSRGGRARPRARRGADPLRALPLDPGGAVARRPPREARAAS